MSLNTLFSEINAMVQQTNGVINALTDPNRYYIDQRLNTAKYYSAYIEREALTHGRELDISQTAAIKYLILSYELLVNEYDDHISQIREGVDIAFTQLYNNITYKLEYAIAETWMEIVDTENYLMGQIGSTTNLIMDAVTAGLTELDTRLTGVVDAVVAEQAEQQDGLLTQILDAASAVYDYVTEQISSAMNTITAWVDELWAYVGTIMDWLTTKFNEFFIQIVDWVSESISAVSARITSVVNSLTAKIMYYYDKAKTLVDTAKGWLVSEIDRLSTTLRGLLNAAIAEVKDLLDNLALLTDWRFTFFNLSLSFPELSFLQVLNRSDEDFKRFKPYWQAFIARVMEED